MKKVTAPQVATSDEAREHPLPERVQEALGELVEQAKGGPLLALSVGVGLAVMQELMAEEVDGPVGPKGAPRPGSQGQAPRL